MRPYDEQYDPMEECDREIKKRDRTIAALQAEVARLTDENLRLRKIASHVPGLVYIKAKEAAGYGVEVKAAALRPSEEKKNG